LKYIPIPHRSFGTDSKLDLDIKERLMQQMFSVMSVLPDDHAVYLAHHKAESEKRLREQKKNLNPQPPEKKVSSNPPRRRDASNIRDNNNTNNSNGAATTQQQQQLQKGISESKEEEEEEESRAVEKSGGVDGESELKGRDDPQGGDEQQDQIQQQQDGEENEEENDDNDQECSVERLEEIKRILTEVYTIYSPEKLSKIDRLLAKYIGHEEEFLDFVFAKYSVDPATYPSSVLRKASKPREKSADVSGGGNEGTAAAAGAAGDSAETDAGTSSKSLPKPTSGVPVSISCVFRHAWLFFAWVCLAGFLS
jgi:hypothetical protein